MKSSDGGKNTSLARPSHWHWHSPAAEDLSMGTRRVDLHKLNGLANGCSNDWKTWSELSNGDAAKYLPWSFRGLLAPIWRPQKSINSWPRGNLERTTISRLQTVYGGIKHFLLLLPQSASSLNHTLSFSWPALSRIAVARVEQGQRPMFFIETFFQPLLWRFVALHLARGIWMFAMDVKIASVIICSLQAVVTYLFIKSSDRSVLWFLRHLPFAVIGGSVMRWIRPQRWGLPVFPVSGWSFLRLGVHVES